MLRERVYRGLALAITASSAYSSVMEVMIFVLGVILVGLASQRWGVDSRPGLGDGRTDGVGRWLPL
jgi:hypothetical protein